MSFQSVDSDEFGIFSSRSCSPCIDNVSQQYDSLENVADKDETQERRNSTTMIVNDRSLYQTISSADLLPEKGTNDAHNSHNSGDVGALDKEDWTLSDYITTSNSCSLPNLLSYEAVSPYAQTQSVTVSWNISDTISPPATVSWNNAGTSSNWNTTGISSSHNGLRTSSNYNTSGTNSSCNTLGTSSVQNTVSWNNPKTSPVQVSATSSKLETITAKDLGSENNLLAHQEVKQFAGANERVSFNEPRKQPEYLFAQSAAKFRKKSIDLSALLSTTKEPKVGLQNINNQCYEAAISEHFGHKKRLKHGQYIAKVKNSKPHSLISKVYDKLQRKSPGQSPVHKQNTEDILTPIKSPTLQSETTTKPVTVTKTTFSTFTTPSIPSPLSPYSASAHSPGQADGRKSPKSPKGETDVKKYRYNQTALALQQSGLMKTTIKTAELLRKSRLLQQELSKLRKETSVFVHMVLNNPENKHLKDMYLSQHNQDNNTESQ